MGQSYIATDRGHVIPRCSVMTPNYNQTSTSRLIFNSISSSLHPGSHEILKQDIHMRGKKRHVEF